jgi:threonine/homoserine/homoserine lactone efflux protein
VPARPAAHTVAARPAAHTVPARPTAPAVPADAAATRGTLLTGIGVSGLNPKGLLLFLAVLPQFSSPRGGWPLAAQLATLGLVFTLSCAAFYLCMGSFARTVLNARPGLALTISRFSGLAMVIVGAILLAERLLSYFILRN